MPSSPDQYIVLIGVLAICYFMFRRGFRTTIDVLDAHGVVKSRIGKGDRVYVRQDVSDPPDPTSRWMHRSYIVSDVGFDGTVIIVEQVPRYHPEGGVNDTDGREVAVTPDLLSTTRISSLN